MPVEVLGVELEVLLDEGGDVEEAVVVTQSELEDVLIVGLDQLIAQVVHQHLLLVFVVCTHIQQQGSLVVVSTTDYKG